MLSLLVKVVIGRAGVSRRQAFLHRLRVERLDSAGDYLGNDSLNAMRVNVAPILETPFDKHKPGCRQVLVRKFSDASPTHDAMPSGMLHTLTIAVDVDLVCCER